MDYTFGSIRQKGKLKLPESGVGGMWILWRNINVFNMLG